MHFFFWRVPLQFERFFFLKDIAKYSEISENGKICKNVQEALKYLKWQNKEIFLGLFHYIKRIIFCAGGMNISTFQKYVKIVWACETAIFCYFVAFRLLQV